MVIDVDSNKLLPISYQMVWNLQTKMGLFE